MLRHPFSMVTQSNLKACDFEYIISYMGLLYVFNPARSITVINNIRLFQS